ncbi:uncharacterized protein LOC123939316 [Meles meles]|uniref:uncharacterized protein LOC123939316 n=1 Tax=Meles meles TaxID=9662 RepID=UPI001E69E9D0|nr:uncharacterized protein LOC123939316 [Meles meles]
MINFRLLLPIFLGLIHKLQASVRSSQGWRRTTSCCHSPWLLFTLGQSVQPPAEPGSGGSRTAEAWLQFSCALQTHTIPECAVHTQIYDFSPTRARQHLGHFHPAREGKGWRRPQTPSAGFLHLHEEAADRVVCAFEGNASGLQPSPPSPRPSSPRIRPGPVSPRHGGSLALSKSQNRKQGPGPRPGLKRALRGDPSSQRRDEAGNCPRAQGRREPQASAPGWGFLSEPHTIPCRPQTCPVPSSATEP